MLSPRAVVKPLLLLLFVAALPATGAPARPQEGPDGRWSGAIATPGQPLDINVTLSGAPAGTWSGSIDIPAQNLTAFPLSDVTVSGDAVRFTMSGVPGEPLFAGTWDADAATISGDFTQGGASYGFSLSRSGDAPAAEGSAAVDAASAARTVGTWQGTLSTGAAELRLAFHIRHEAGALTGTMDSPDQGQTDLPISRITFDGTSLRVDLDYAGAYFEGILSDDDATLEGIWNQGGGALPLTMRKQ